MSFLSLMMFAWTFVTICSGETTPDLFFCTPFTFLPENAVNNITLTTTILRCPSYAAIHRAIGFSYKDDRCALKGVGLRNKATAELINCFLVPPPEDLIEVARLKIVSASPPFYPFISVFAVDMDITTFYASNDGIATPWFMVDLGNTYKIHKIMVLTRRALFYRFKNIEVRCGLDLLNKGNFTSWTLLTYFTGTHTLSQGVLTLHVNGEQARYISLQRMTAGDNNLQIADLQVMAANK